MSTDFLLVHPTKMAPNRSLAMSVHGTQGAKTFYRTAAALDGFGVRDELHGGLVFNFNQETKPLLQRLPSGLYVYAPKHPIPGLPKGFNGNPLLAEQTRHHWEPVEERGWEELHRHAAKHGLPVGVIFHNLSPAGGHMPTCAPSVVIGRRHFSGCLHIGTFYLPNDSDGRILWDNLRDYEDYPDNLGIPILLAENIHAELLDRAFPMLAAMLISGQRFVDKKQHSLLEEFSYLTQRCSVLGLAAAEVELPVVPVNVFRWLLGRRPGVAEQEVLPKVAELFAKVLQPEAQLIDCEPPDPEEPQFVAIGGMPIPRNNDSWLHTREDFKRRVQDIVIDTLAHQTPPRTVPPGLTAMWSSAVEQLENRYARILAVRVFPIHDKKVRDFVDAMLATDQRPPRRRLTA